MRANRAAVIIGLEQVIELLVETDVEVVVPEVDHDFVELAPAVDCPNHSSLLQIKQNIPPDPRPAGVARVFLQDLARGHGQGIQRRQSALNVSIFRPGGGRKLLIDKGIQPHPGDALNVAGPRTKHDGGWPQPGLSKRHFGQRRGWQCWRGGRRQRRRGRPGRGHGGRFDDKLMGRWRPAASRRGGGCGAQFEKPASVQRQAGSVRLMFHAAYCGARCHNARRNLQKPRKAGRLVFSRAEHE